MKKKIHPECYPNASVKCICGNSFEVGSTAPKISVEICSKCHPFYTGKDKIIDTAGRVERFKKRLEKARPTERAFGRATKKTKPLKKARKSSSK